MNKDTTPTLSEADKHFITDKMQEIWSDWDNEGKSEFQKAAILAEDCILHARVEHDKLMAFHIEMQETWAKRYQTQAERIKELEAALTAVEQIKVKELEASVELYKRHFLNEEKTSEERWNRIEELEAEVALYIRRMSDQEATIRDLLRKRPYG